MCSSCPPFLWGYKLTVNYLGLVQNKLVLAIWKSVGGTNKTFFSSGVSFRALQLCLMGLRCYWGPLNQTPDHNEEMLLLFQETSTLRLTLITVTRSSLKYIYIFFSLPSLVWWLGPSPCDWEAVRLWILVWFQSLFSLLLLNRKIWRVF